MNWAIKYLINITILFIFFVVSIIGFANSGIEFVDSCVSVSNSYWIIRNMFSFSAGMFSLCVFIIYLLWVMFDFDNKKPDVVEGEKE